MFPGLGHFLLDEVVGGILAEHLVEGRHGEVNVEQPGGPSENGLVGLSHVHS